MGVGQAGSGDATFLYDPHPLPLEESAAVGSSVGGCGMGVGWV